MDDELEKLEAELRRLRPVAPRASVWNGAARLVVRARKRSVRRPVLAAWLLPMAAAIALVAAWLTRGDKGEAGGEVVALKGSAGRSGAAFKPVAAENVLLAAREEGYVSFADGTPARRVRSVYLDTITWRDAETQASFTWRVPREEVQLVPVSFQ